MSPPKDLTAALDAVVDRALAEQRIVGGIVLVAQGGRPAYSRAAGLADREAGRHMALDSILRLSSLTKPIVTAAESPTMGPTGSRPSCLSASVASRSPVARCALTQRGGPASEIMRSKKCVPWTMSSSPPPRASSVGWP